MKININLEIDTESWEDKKIVEEMIEYLKTLQLLHMPEDSEDE